MLYQRLSWIGCHGHLGGISDDIIAIVQEKSKLALISSYYASISSQ